MEKPHNFSNSKHINDQKHIFTYFSYSKFNVHPQALISYLQNSFPHWHTPIFLATYNLGIDLTLSTINCQLIDCGSMQASSLEISHAEDLFGALHPSIITFSQFSRLCTIFFLFVDFNNMHIYAFIVMHIHKNAFKCIICLHMHRYAHNYTYFISLKIPHRSRQLHP